MLKNKKTLLIIVISFIVIVAVIISIILIKKNTASNTETTKEEQGLTVEELENNFKNAFYNIEYKENEESLITTVYQLNKSEENKYNVNVNFPKINLSTEIAQKINDEIINTYGVKLLDILKNNKEYTLYNVDYVSYTNDNTLSVVIKSTLKEGSNPQRVMLQTFNYDLDNNKELTLEDILELKQIEKNSVQSKIIETVRQKNTNATDYAEQGYNIFVRDIRSDEYLIQNIKTYFIGEKGHVFIVFPYGNNNYTATMDIIVL